MCVLYEVILYNNKCCLWGNFVCSNTCQKWNLETHLYRVTCVWSHVQQLTGALITFFHVKNSDLIKIVDSWTTFFHVKNSDLIKIADSWTQENPNWKPSEPSCSKLLDEKLKWWHCHVCSRAQWIPILPKRKPNLFLVNLLYFFASLTHLSFKLCKQGKLLRSHKKPLL